MKLLGFLFTGILFALAYKLGVEFVYQNFFPTSRFFETYWYVPFALVPGLILVALALAMGFFRKADWADLAITLILIAIVGLTLPTSYACGLGCF